MRLAFLAFTFAFLAPVQNFQKSSIQGTVTAAATGKVIRGTRISLIRNNGGTETSLRSVTTDNTGRFSFTGVDGGDYRLYADSDGFVHQEYGQKKAEGRGATLSITPGQKLTIDFQLMAAGVITGRVLDEFGDPVPGAGVNAQLYRYINGRRVLLNGPSAQVAQADTFLQVLHATTDDRGEYRLFWLPPGDYYVSATARPQFTSPSIADVGTPQPPVQDRCLGGFSSSSLPDSLYSIYFPSALGPEGASAVSVAASAEVRGIDIVWRPVRKASICGRVISPETGSSDPRPFASGRQVRTQGGTMALTHADGSPGVSSGSSGGRGDIFEFRGIAAGSYYVNILERRDDLNYFGRARVDIQDKDINDVVVTLQPSTNLRGRIVLDSGAPPSFRMSQIRISLSDDLGLGGTSGTQVTEAGTFTLLRVLPTKLRIVTGGISQGGYVAAAKYGPDDLLVDPFTPRNDQEVEIHISFLSGIVSGSVVDSAGKLFSGAVVMLIPEQSKRERFDLYSTRTTDASGRFNFTDVPAGTYSVFAWEEIPGGAEQSLEFMRPFEGRGTPVRVENGSVENIRLQIIS